MVAVPPGRVTLSDRRTRSTWQVDVTPFRLPAFPGTRSRYARHRPEAGRRRGHPTFRIDDVGFRAALHPGARALTAGIDRPSGEGV